MKKIILLIICTCLVLQLTACAIPAGPATENSSSLADIPTTVNTPSETASETPETDSFLPQVPLVAVSLPVVTESATASDGTVIFNYTFQNISLIAPDADVADQIIIDFLNRIDSTRAVAEEIHDLASQAYHGQELWNPYLCMITFAPKRTDAGVLSLFGTQAAYYGSPHPETVYSAVNYDLVTGTPLTLGDILPDTATTDVLLEQVLNNLKMKKSELYLYEGFEQTVRSHFASSNLQNSWYFTPTGLCFYFAPYEIAPYSSGVIEAEISYDMLAGILNDAYFPAELDTPKGNLSVDNFNDSDLEDYSRFAEIVLDTEGQKILLHTDHIVQNIRIESGSWSSTGSFFTPQHTVFSASTLVAGDALMIEAQLSLTPQLRLSYESDGITVSIYIIKNSDGSVTLVNASEL